MLLFIRTSTNSSAPEHVHHLSNLKFSCPQNYKNDFHSLYVTAEREDHWSLMCPADQQIGHGAKAGNITAHVAMDFSEKTTT